MRARNSAVLPRSTSSESFCISASSELIAATRGWRRLTSRSFLVPKTLPNKVLIKTEILQRTHALNHQLKPSTLDAAGLLCGASISLPRIYGPSFSSSSALAGAASTHPPRSRSTTVELPAQGGALCSSNLFRSSKPIIVRAESNFLHCHRVTLNVEIGAVPSFPQLPLVYSPRTCTPSTSVFRNRPASFQTMLPLKFNASRRSSASLSRNLRACRRAWRTGFRPMFLAMLAWRSWQRTIPAGSRHIWESSPLDEPLSLSTRLSTPTRSRSC